MKPGVSYAFAFKRNTNPLATSLGTETEPTSEDALASEGNQTGGMSAGTIVGIVVGAVFLLFFMTDFYLHGYKNSWTRKVLKAVFDVFMAIFEFAVAVFAYS